MYKVFLLFDKNQVGYIDNPMFRKVLLACELLPDKLAINEIDLIYTTAKARYRESQFSKGLTYEAFVHALLMIAKDLHE